MVDPQVTMVDSMLAARSSPSLEGREAAWSMMDMFYGENHNQQKSRCYQNIYPLVICYIAIENGHRNSGFSH